MNDEARIISGIREGGTKRNLCENELYSYFFYFTGSSAVKKYKLNEDEAASAYSDTILTLIGHIAGGIFKGQSSLKTYAFSIFSNKCVDAIRKKTTNKNSVNTDWKELSPRMSRLPDNVRTVLDQLIAKDYKELVRQKIKELGEKCQKILFLFEEDYKDQKIADLMGYSSADVAKTSRLRCLEKLKELVSEKQLA